MQEEEISTVELTSLNKVFELLCYGGVKDNYNEKELNTSQNKEEKESNKDLNNDKQKLYFTEKELTQVLSYYEYEAKRE